MFRPKDSLDTSHTRYHDELILASLSHPRTSSHPTRIMCRPLRLRPVLSSAEASASPSLRSSPSPNRRFWRIEVSSGCVGIFGGVELSTGSDVCSNCTFPNTRPSYPSRTTHVSQSLISCQSHCMSAHGHIDTEVCRPCILHEPQHSFRRCLHPRSEPQSSSRELKP